MQVIKSHHVVHQETNLFFIFFEVGVGPIRLRRECLHHVFCRLLKHLSNDDHVYDKVIAKKLKNLSNLIVEKLISFFNHERLDFQYNISLLKTKRAIIMCISFGLFWPTLPLINWSYYSIEGRHGLHAN